MLDPVPAPATGVAAKRTRSFSSYVEAALLLAVGLGVAGVIIELLRAGVDVRSGIVLVGGAPLLAVVGAIGLLLAHQMLRLAVIAAALGGMVVMLVVAPLELAFIYDRTYLFASVLESLLPALLIAAFAAAWHESGLQTMWTLLMLAAGGVSGLMVTGFLFWLFLVVALLIHPLTF
jgi:hypothetical protein